MQFTIHKRYWLALSMATLGVIVLANPFQAKAGPMGFNGSFMAMGDFNNNWPIRRAHAPRPQSASGRAPRP